MQGLKTFSSKELIARFIQDFGISSSGISANMYEWIGDAVQGIGYSANIEILTKKICIENHRGNFPCGLINIIGVLYNGVRLPLGSDVSLYGIIDWTKNSGKTSLNTEAVDKLKTLITLLKAQQAKYDDYILTGGSSSDTEAITLLGYITDTSEKINNITKNVILGKNAPNTGLDYYNANTDGLITSFEEGEVVIIYSSLPVDDEGFPKLIDSFKYKEAITWYCLYRAILRGYEHKTIKDYREALQMWEKYRFQASNESKMFSQDEAEQFKNMWVNAKFNAESWANFFINNEQPTGKTI